MTVVITLTFRKTIQWQKREFTSKVTGNTYFIKEHLSYNSTNVIYLTTCGKCKDEYIGSAVYFKPCFKVQKSDTKAKKKRGGTSRHFQEKCLVPFLLLHTSKLKSLCRLTLKTYQKLNKSFVIKQNNDKANYLQYLQQKT